MLNNPLKYTDPSGYTYRAQAVTFKGRENPDGSYGNFAGFDGGGGSVFQKMGVLNGEAGPVFEDLYFEGPTGNWVRRSGLQKDVVARYVSKDAYVSVGSQRYFKGSSLHLSIEPLFEPVEISSFNSDKILVKEFPKFIMGQSFDATLALVSAGYTAEAGLYIADNGQEGSPFVSHGYTIGLEGSVGYNFIFIKTKDNFKFSDLEGMGASAVINYGYISISILGNTSPGYPENSMFDSYFGIKIGIGAGAGGSYTPDSKTTFCNWIPDISKSNFHWR